MSDINNLKAITNIQPVPSLFNEGFSQYETVSKLLKLTDDLINDMNEGVDEIKGLKDIIENSVDTIENISTILEDNILIVDTLTNDIANKIEVVEGLVSNLDVQHLNNIDSQLANNTQQLDLKLDKTGLIAVNQIDKNKGLIDETYLSDTLKAQMAGTTAIGSTPPDKSITPSKATFFKIGTNLVDKSKALIDMYVRTSDGVVTALAGYIAIENIEVTPTETYTIKNAKHYAWYTEAGVFISGISSAGGVKTIVAPANAKTLNFSFSPSECALSIQQVNIGSKVLAFEDYKIFIPEEYQEQQVNISKFMPNYERFTFDITTGVSKYCQPQRVYELSKLQQSFKLKATYKLEVPTEFQNLVASLKLLVLGSTTINETTSSVSFYSTSSVYSSAVTDFSHVITIDNLTNLKPYIQIFPVVILNAVGAFKYSITNFNLEYSIDDGLTYNDFSEFLISNWYNYGHTSFACVTDYIEKEVYNKVETIEQINNSIGNITGVYVHPLLGKAWCPIGDSITDKTNKSVRNYYDYLADRSSVIPYEYGQDGSSFETRQTVANTITQIPDFITVFLGTNDYQIGTKPLGVFGDTGIETVAGLVYNVIRSLIVKFPLARIGVMTPLPRTSVLAGWGIGGQINDRGYTLEDLSEMIIKHCKHFSISYLDLYHESGLPVWNTGTYTNFVPDGLHPNDAGHTRLSFKIEQWMLEI